MAKIGFKSAHIHVPNTEGTGYTTYNLDKTKGGAIEATISGLGAEATTVYASNVPFFVSAKGTGETTVSLNVFDLQAGGAYSAVLGITADENGIMTVGQDTQAPYVSVTFVSDDADGNEVYMGLTKVRFAHPDVALNTSEGGGTDPNTDTIEGSAISDSRGYVYASGVKSETLTLEKFQDFVANKTTPVGS